MTSGAGSFWTARGTWTRSVRNDCTVKDGGVLKEVREHCQGE